MFISFFSSEQKKPPTAKGQKQTLFLKSAVSADSNHFYLWFPIG